MCVMIDRVVDQYQRVVNSIDDEMRLLAVHTHLSVHNKLCIFSKIKDGAMRRSVLKPKKQKQAVFLLVLFR